MRRDIIIAPAQSKPDLFQVNAELRAEIEHLREENERLKAQLEETHAEANGMHDEMVASGVRQETFGV